MLNELEKEEQREVEDQKLSFLRMIERTQEKGSMIELKKAKYEE